MRGKVTLSLCAALLAALAACSPTFTPSAARLETIDTPTASVPPTATATPASPGVAAAPCIGPEEASQHVGEFVCVDYCIAGTHNSGQAAFLNSHDPYEGYFYSVIFPERWDCWPENPDVYFADTCIRVQGKVELYAGAPEIVVRTCDQVSALATRPPEPGCGEELGLDALAAAIGADSPMLPIVQQECLAVMDRQRADVTGDGEDDDMFLTVAAGCVSCHLWRLWVFSGGDLVLVHAGGDMKATPHDDGAGLEVVESVYEQGEPMCCPSHKRVTDFRWTGVSFTQASSVVVAADSDTSASSEDAAQVAGCVLWRDAGSYIGQSTCVYGIVASTHNAGTAFFIDFSDDDRSSFYGVSFDYYWTDLEGRCVVLVGTVEDYEGRPEIVIERGDQVHYCDEAPAADAGLSEEPAVPAADPSLAESASPELPPTQGCYLFENYLGAELNVTFTRQSDNWNDTFRVPADSDWTYCLEPGKYTYTIDAPPPWESINGDLVVQPGDRYTWPVAGQ